MKRVGVLVVVALTALTFSGTNRAIVNARATIPVLAKATTPPSAAIPNNFKTYSLFLVCNPEWLAPENSKGLYSLYLRYNSFGRTIGDDNLAVWFVKSEFKGDDDQELAKETDVERSVRFCKAWKLKPSEGPHIVVTSTYPNESNLSAGLPKDSAVFGLGDMGPKEISALFIKLTDDLIEKGKLDKPTAVPKAPMAFWVRLLEVTQASINSFGCLWSFKIEAGGVSANLHSCQTR